MRAVLIGLVLAGSAAADPPPKPIVIEDVAKLFPEGWLDFTKGKTPGTTTQHPAFGGGTSLGMVVEPKPHPDAQPFPNGMVIRPPDVKDRNVIAPGTRGFARGSSLGRRFLDGIDEVADRVWSLVIPTGT